MDLFFIDKENRVRIRKVNTIEKDGELCYEETSEWREYKSKKSAVLSLEKCSIPPHVANLSLDDYIGPDRDKIEKLKLYVENFGEKFNSIHLYFWSKENGTQKTTTASIVGKMLMEKGFSVQFVLMSFLLKTLAEEKFSPEMTEVLDKYRTCDFLIIDDSFDRKKATVYKSGFQIPFMDEFLRTRLEIQRKATCFSSNFSIADIDEDTFGISLKTLIKRNIKDPFHFSSSYQLVNDFDVDDLWS